MINLFIDTNIFLGFYFLSSDDLEELKKLSLLIRTEKVQLVLPQQVIDEFNRNRDNQISNGLKILKEEKLNNQFPQFCKGYDEYKEMRSAIQLYDESKKTLLKKLLEDIEDNVLKADLIIGELFGYGTIINVTKSIYNEAIIRFNRGNPPGKDKSYGDAINWLSICDAIKEGDIHIITDDGDYVSATNGSMIKPFLRDEWQAEKDGEAILYKRLSEFFGLHFKDIKLADEYEKEQLIKSLVESSNFRTTHGVIWDLNKFTNFTKSQAEEIIEAAIVNNQIKWIGEDKDVRGFLDKVLKENKDLIDQDLLGAYYEIYEPEDPDSGGSEE